jgi:hypothetical protein
MKLGYSPNGEAFVAGYDPGDMVMLVAQEAGALGQGRFGDWGKVKSVDAAGMLTIVVAGYSVPRGAPLAMLSDIPARRVKPCTAKGEVTILPHQVNSEKLWDHARPGGGECRQRL